MRGGLWYLRVDEFVFVFVFLRMFIFSCCFFGKSPENEFPISHFSFCALT